jgi:hypothetical protein
MLYATLSILLILSPLMPQQRIAQEPLTLPEQPAGIFKRVERIGNDRRGFFLFVSGRQHYTIRSDGLGQVEAPKTFRRRFHLSLGQAGRIVRFYSAEYENDLLFVYEVANENYGWGFVERFNQKTLTAKWRRPLKAVNLGPALVEQNFAYLSGFYLLAKIDLSSGSYIWQQEQFDSDYTPTTEVLRPNLREERVAFATNDKVIEVDKNTGKVLAFHNQEPIP